MHWRASRGIPLFDWLAKAVGSGFRVSDPAETALGDEFVPEPAADAPADQLIPLEQGWNARYWLRFGERIAGLHE